jgi:hypothetical protein
VGRSLKKKKTWIRQRSPISIYQDTRIEKQKKTEDNSRAWRANTKNV